MTNLTIGTFNLNNLFDRFNFQAEIGAVPARDRDVRTTYQWVVTGRGTAPGAPPPQLDPTESTSPVYRIQRGTDGTLIKPKSERELASLAGRISAMDLDVLCVQEVENLDALRAFNRSHLDSPYRYEVLVEGNDPRFIDVAVLSRLPVANVTSNRFETHPDEPDAPVFGRDALGVDILTPTRSRRLITIFVNHLKSNFVRFDDPDPDATQAANRRRRLRQAQVLRRVVEDRTRPRSKFVVLGDMNDAPDAESLEPFAGWLTDGMQDAVESALPPPATNPVDVPGSPRWTHRLSVSNGPDRFELLDQIWLSPSLAPRLDHAEIQRRPAWSATSVGVGSDHDPAWVRLTGL